MIKRREIPGLTEATSWLSNHRPLDFVPGVMHGDYQFPNVMFRHGAPARLAAIVDWEMGTVGDPKLDLAWALHSWPQDATDPSDNEYLVGMPARSRLLEYYAERSGRQVDDFDYYIVLARWKLAIVLEQGYQRAAGDAKLEEFGEYVLKYMREAADFIRAAIVSGEFPARSKVDQDDIAEALGISRAPVREALIELAQKGFVVAPPRRGAFVAELTVEDIEDYYEVVAAVFGMTTRRAVTKLTPADVDELRRLDTEIAEIAGTAEVAGTADDARRRKLDRRFFDVIVASGRSPRLDSILQLLGGMFQGSFYFESPGWAANEASFRRRLLAAIEAADERQAARTSEEHLRACAIVTIVHLRATGYWAPSI